MKKSEARGLTHWMIYSDGHALYAYNLVVGDKKVSTLIEDLTNVVSIAVDKNHGYLFVAMQGGAESATVDRFNFTVDATQATPKLSVNAGTRLNVYKGKHIESLAIDDDQSILYIADSKTKRIDSIQYSASILKKSNSNSGLADTLYETVNNLASVTSLAIDYQGNIYWSVGD